jgi:hypothetical protein
MTDKTHTRTEYAAALLAAMGGMQDSELAEWFEKVQALDPKVTFVRYRVPLQAEELKAMFPDETVSPEVQTRIQTLFEAAVAARVNLDVADIQDKLLMATELAYMEFIGEQKAKLGAYIDYAVVHWIAKGLNVKLED